MKCYCVMSQYKPSNGGGSNMIFIHFIGAAAIAVNDDDMLSSVLGKMSSLNANSNR